MEQPRRHCSFQLRYQFLETADLLNTIPQIFESGLRVGEVYDHIEELSRSVLDEYVVKEIEEIVLEGTYHRRCLSCKIVPTHDVRIVNSQFETPNDSIQARNGY